MKVAYNATIEISLEIFMAKIAGFGLGFESELCGTNKVLKTRESIEKTPV